MWNVVLLGVPLKRWALYAGILVGGALSPLRPGVVWGESMEPSLRHGQPYVFAPYAHHFGAIQRGEIVLFSHEGRTYMKRVLAGPGDTVYLLRYRDDTMDEVLPAWKLALFNRHLNRRRWDRLVRVAKVDVPRDALYVVGDNLAGSEDSRSFGTVPLSSLRGKVLFAPQADPEWMSLATAVVKGPAAGPGTPG